MRPTSREDTIVERTSRSGAGAASEQERREQRSDLVAGQHPPGRGRDRPRHGRPPRVGRHRGRARGRASRRTPAAAAEQQLERSGLLRVRSLDAVGKSGSGSALGGDGADPSDRPLNPGPSSSRWLRRRAAPCTPRDGAGSDRTGERGAHGPRTGCASVAGDGRGGARGPRGRGVGSGDARPRLDGGVVGRGRPGRRRRPTTLSPLSPAGLWLAVTMTPADAAASSVTAKVTSGVGTSTVEPGHVAAHW